MTMTFFLRFMVGFISNFELQKLLANLLYILYVVIEEYRMCSTAEQKKIYH